MRPLTRWAPWLVAILLLSSCGGGAEKRASSGRTLEPARVLVGGDGSVFLVGIARLLGEGYECGSQRRETAEFVAARLLPSGKVSTVPQDELEWCAERVEEAVVLPNGHVAVGGSIAGAAESEGSADRGFIAARLRGTGELLEIANATSPTTRIAGWLLDREPPLGAEAPEVRGLAELPGGRVAIGKYQAGFPNYTLHIVGSHGRQVRKTQARTRTEAVVLGVEANRHGIYVLTEEFPVSEAADYRYGL